MKEQEKNRKDYGFPCARIKSPQERPSPLPRQKTQKAANPSDYNNFHAPIDRFLAPKKTHRTGMRYTDERMPNTNRHLPEKSRRQPSVRC